jgi:hypothetical protein
MNLSGISTEELLFDRQESFNDLVALIWADKHGVGAPQRAKRNLEIIETIRLECERRGFDPAQYRRVATTEE